MTRRRVIRTAPSRSPIPDRRTAQSLDDQATQLLREELVGGRFGFGTRLNEMRLADDFSLSRGPICEALRGLEREGLIVALAGMRAAKERDDWGQMSERHARFHGTLSTEAAAACFRRGSRRHPPTPR